MIYLMINKETLKICGQYESDFKKDSSSYWGYAVCEPICAHIELPEGLDSDCVIAQLNGEQIELIEDITKVEAKQALVKQNQVTEAYNRMNSDILTEMTMVFGTTRTDSASAYNETWKLMASNPVLFTHEGLKADKEVGAFNPGDVLNTEQKIQDYANARIAEANAYAVYRMKRIEQFRVERATLLA